MRDVKGSLNHHASSFEEFGVLRKRGSTLESHDYITTRVL